MRSLTGPSDSLDTFESIAHPLKILERSSRRSSRRGCGPVPHRHGGGPIPAQVWDLRQMRQDLGIGAFELIWELLAVGSGEKAPLLFLLEARETVSYVEEGELTEDHDLNHGS